jgi:hypothetical protein
VHSSSGHEFNIAIMDNKMAVLQRFKIVPIYDPSILLLKEMK